MKNGAEADVDCGGGTCAACATGKKCTAVNDCVSGVCSSGTCVAGTCTDGVKNGLETDVDCGGGTCVACVAGKKCGLSTDCKSAVCTSGLCAAVSCSDGVKNGAETDIDCGGGTCATCAAGKACGLATDCGTGVCTSGACVAASCSDGVKNGAETDTDCGGGSCNACAAGKSCGGTTDCVSGVCTSGACVAGTCTDGVKNGAETDTDCGGGTCTACAAGKKCSVVADCDSGVCTAGACAAATCTDSVTNGAETDVDCGGGTCAACAVGKVCAKGADCAAGVCTSGACAAASCSDAVKNGSETDVDCGGTCNPCAAGKKCTVAKDCATNLCTSGACAYAASCAKILAGNTSAGSGVYTIQPASAPVKVYCDMTTDGGGWTQLLQCLPTDGCTAGGKVIYNEDWLAADLGSLASASASYLAGKSLSALTLKGQFMVQVTDTAKKRDGYIIYPLDATTRKFFSSGTTYQSSSLAMTVIDHDKRVEQRSARICWAPKTSPYARSYQGISGMRFLGRTSAKPAATANSGCDYGPWGSQMLIRRSSVSSLTTTWGMSPVADWTKQAHAHRVFVREQVVNKISIVASGSGRTWSDKTVARSCYEYRHPTGGRSYSGKTGNGLYTIKPDDSSAAIIVLCDMTSNGGGWTLLATHKSSAGFFGTHAKALSHNVANPAASLYSIVGKADRFMRNGVYTFWYVNRQYNKYIISSQTWSPLASGNVGKCPAGNKVLSSNYTPTLFCGYTPGPNGWSAINGYGPNWTHSVGQLKTYGSWPLVCTHNSGYTCNHIQFYVK